MTGALLIGILASSHINKVEASLGQFGVQVLAVAIVAIYASVVTLILLKILDALGILRVPDAIQMSGARQGRDRQRVPIISGAWIGRSRRQQAPGAVAGWTMLNEGAPGPLRSGRAAPPVCTPRREASALPSRS